MDSQGAPWEAQPKVQSRKAEKPQGMDDWSRWGVAQREGSDMVPRSLGGRLQQEEGGRARVWVGL